MLPAGLLPISSDTIMIRFSFSTIRPSGIETLLWRRSVMALPLVAIVGRPNVGKSSLFNRVLGQRRAIVDPMAGLTRDRLYAEADWRGRNFTIVDTAGLVLGKERDEVPALRELRRRMEEQTAVAIEEADVILLVVDVREGVTPIDSDIAELLRRARTPVVLAANKADGRDSEGLAAEYDRSSGDRKSTRLNSSHTVISYAVFCLKKKNA